MGVVKFCIFLDYKSKEVSCKYFFFSYLVVECGDNAVGDVFFVIVLSYNSIPHFCFRYVLLFFFSLCCSVADA